MLGIQAHTFPGTEAVLRVQPTRWRTLPAQRVAHSRRGSRPIRSRPSCSASLQTEATNDGVNEKGDVRTFRRSFLSLVAATAAATCTGETRAADAPPEDDNPLGTGQPVRPALSARAYLNEIAAKKGPALGLLRQLAEDEDYGRLANALVLSPYDDLRQSCYYLPWVVVRKDEKLGTDMELAYVEIRESMIALDSVALAADRYESDLIEVRAALSRLEEAYGRYFALAAQVKA